MTVRYDVRFVFQTPQVLFDLKGFSGEGLPKEVPDGDVSAAAAGGDVWLSPASLYL
eukprot:COSAG01_NODE_852_length_13108_cov_7.167423_15_plen_56_part_00